MTSRDIIIRLRPKLTSVFSIVWDSCIPSITKITLIFIDRWRSMEFNTLSYWNWEERKTFTVTNSQRSAWIWGLNIAILTRLCNLKAFWIKEVWSDWTWLNNSITIFIYFAFCFANSIITVVVIAIFVRLTGISRQSILGLSLSINTWFLSTFIKVRHTPLNSIVHRWQITVFVFTITLLSIKCSTVLILCAVSCLDKRLSVTFKCFASWAESDS